MLLARASKKRKDFYMSAVVLKPGEGRALPLGPIQMVVQEDGTHTRGTLGLAEFEVPPHAPTPPPHIHHAHEEGFYILEGELVSTKNKVVDSPNKVADWGNIVA